MMRRVIRVPDSSAMHELNDDLPAGGMNRVGDFAPTCNLGFVIQSGSQHVSLPVFRRLSSLADDQRHGCALRIVLGVDLGGRPLRRRSVSGHGRHRQAMLQAKLSSLDGPPKQVTHLSLLVYMDQV